MVGSPQKLCIVQTGSVEKSSHSANFFAVAINVAKCVFQLFLAKQQLFWCGWDSVKKR